MNPRILTYLFFLIAALTAFSCSEIELDGADEEKKEEKSDNDSSTPDEDEVISVAALANVGAGSEVTLRCYIVGTTTYSLKNTVFGIDDEKTVSTNIVVADSPDETKYENCVACQLKSNSEPREDLNLLDNPDNLGQLVYITGTANKYFYKMGISPVISYAWSLDGDDEDGDDNDGDDENPGESDNSTLSIPISADAAAIFEGC